MENKVKSNVKVISKADAFEFLKANLKNCEFYSHISSQTNKQASAIVYNQNGENEFIPFSSKSLARLNIVDEGKQAPLIEAIKTGKLILATLDKKAKSKDGRELSFNARCFCTPGRGEGFADLEL